MDLGKILEKKGVEAGDSDSERVEAYKRTHLIEFEGHTIPYHEYEALEEIMQKYKLKIISVEFGNEHVTGLGLYNKGIKHIEELPGLENLANLKELNLGWNQITEIKGLENLTNLQMLNLSNNQITEIEGLENLTDLKELYLWENNLNSDSGKVVGSLRKRGVRVWT